MEGMVLPSHGMQQNADCNIRTTALRLLEAICRLRRAELGFQDAGTVAESHRAITFHSAQLIARVICAPPLHDIDSADDDMLNEATREAAYWHEMMHQAISVAAASAASTSPEAAVQQAEHGIDGKAEVHHGDHSVHGTDTKADPEHGIDGKAAEVHGVHHGIDAKAEHGIDGKAAEVVHGVHHGIDTKAEHVIGRKAEVPKDRMDSGAGGINSEAAVVAPADRWWWAKGSCGSSGMTGEKEVLVGKPKKGVVELSYFNQPPGSPFCRGYHSGFMRGARYARREEQKFQKMREEEQKMKKHPAPLPN